MNVRLVKEGFKCLTDVNILKTFKYFRDKAEISAVIGYVCCRTDKTQHKYQRLARTTASHSRYSMNVIRVEMSRKSIHIFSEVQKIILTVTALVK